MNNKKNIRKDLILLKVFTISMSFFYLFLSIMVFVKLNSIKVSLLFVFSALIVLSTLLITKYFNQNISKFILIIFFPASFVLLSSYTKSLGLTNDVFLYLAPKIFTILSLILPFLIFSYKNIKYSIIAIIPISIFIIIFDYVHNLFGINLKDLSINYDYYMIFNLVNIIAILIFLGGLISLKYVNFNNEKVLRNLNVDLSEKTKDLETLYESIDLKNKMLKDFSYTLSHDLKSPLRAIMSLISFSMDDLEKEKIILPKKVHSNIKEIKKRIELMDSLISGILKIAQSGGIIDKVLFDSNNVINNIKNSITIPANFQIIIKSDLPKLYMNRFDFQQITQNLVTNSIKYNDKKNGNILIDVVYTNENVTFHFKDNGKGIKEENYNKVFSIFETIDYNKTNTKNTGIGLSIVKKIVEKYDGKIAVISEYGKWTDFIITFPIKILDKSYIENQYLIL